MNQSRQMNRYNMEVSILGSGMMTSVGLNAPASCAAIRCNLENSVVTEFIDDHGEWIVGNYVPLENSARGRVKLIQLIVSSIRECLGTQSSQDTANITLLLCVAEENRPGRFAGLDDQLIQDIQKELAIGFSPHSKVIIQGRVGGVMAVKKAMELIHTGATAYCVIAGVDTYLTAGTLTAYGARSRLFTESNSNGFIPGEAGAAVLLGPTRTSEADTMTIHGIGFGREAAHIESEEPLRGDGMVQAINEALNASGWALADTDYRITDANGEDYVFKEAALAMTRTLKMRKQEFDIWHPSECVGEIGAAVVPCCLAVALTAARKKYAPGKRVICHFGNDAGERAAMVMSYRENGGY